MALFLLRTFPLNVRRLMNLAQNMQGLSGTCGGKADNLCCIFIL